MFAIFIPTQKMSPRRFSHVTQGDPCSPFLFIISIEVLLGAVRVVFPDANNILARADDVATPIPRLIGERIENLIRFVDIFELAAGACWQDILGAYVRSVERGCQLSP